MRPPVYRCLHPPARACRPRPLPPQPPPHQLSRPGRWGCTVSVRLFSIQLRGSAWFAQHGQPRAAAGLHSWRDGVI